MAAELIENYRGVACICCRQPIAVSSKVADIRDQLESQGTNSPRTFSARCPLCASENVYSLAEIQTITGHPRQRKPKARAAKSAA